MKLGFGERLRNEMKAQGWTETLLAQDLGLKSRSLNHWVNERSEPKFEVLQAISALLKVNLHWVLTGNGTVDLPEQTLCSGENKSRDQFYREMREINERRIALMVLEKKQAQLAREIERFNKSAPTEEQVSQEVKA